MFPVHVLVACKIIGHKAKVWIIVAGSGSRVKVIGNRARAIWGKKKPEVDGDGRRGKSKLAF